MKSKLANVIISISIIISIIGIAIFVCVYYTTQHTSNTENGKIVFDNNFAIIEQTIYGFDIIYHKSTKIVYSLTNRRSGYPGILSPLYDSDGSILLYDPEDWV